MAWIELHQSVATHAKTITLCDLLDMPEYAAVGLLSCLWLWAVDNAPEGVLPDVPRRIARAIRWDKQPDDLIDALITAGFLDRTDEGLIIHDWHDYAGKLIDQRQANAERQKNWRDRRKSGGGNLPLDQSPLSQRNAHVTVTSPSRNAATRPDQTVPNQTNHHPLPPPEGGEVGVVKTLGKEIGETPALAATQAATPEDSNTGDDSEGEESPGLSEPHLLGHSELLRLFRAAYPEQESVLADILSRARPSPPPHAHAAYLRGHILRFLSGKEPPPIPVPERPPGDTTTVVPIEHRTVPQNQSPYKLLYDPKRDGPLTPLPSAPKTPPVVSSERGDFQERLRQASLVRPNRGAEIRPPPGEGSDAGSRTSAETPSDQSPTTETGDDSRKPT